MLVVEYSATLRRTLFRFGNSCDNFRWKFLSYNDLALLVGARTRHHRFHRRFQATGWEAPAIFFGSDESFGNVWWIPNTIRESVWTTRCSVWDVHATRHCSDDFCAIACITDGDQDVRPTRGEPLTTSVLFRWSSCRHVHHTGLVRLDMGRDRRKRYSC